MSLENELKKNTEALIANTNALAANEKGTTPVSSPAPVQASPAASAPVTADVLADVPVAGGILDDAPLATTPEPAAVAAPAGEVIDKKQVIAAFIDLGKAKGREVAVQFLAANGVSKASEFNDPTKYVEILAGLKAATA